MSKKKKNQPRPRFKCYRCGLLWVSDSDPICWLCHIPGTPLNEGAEKIIKKRSEDNGRYFKESV